MENMERQRNQKGYWYVSCGEICGRDPLVSSRFIRPSCKTNGRGDSLHVQTGRVPAVGVVVDGRFVARVLAPAARQLCLAAGFDRGDAA
jgi:hypothetical protein